MRNKHAILHFIFIVTLFVLPFFSISQSSSIGKPFITNYTKDDIGYESLTNAIVQDSRGIMYFANNFGILEFDGSNWRFMQTSSNKSNIISLAIDKNNRIYAGAQGDIGYLDYHPEYNLIFKSLLDKIPENHREFGDVWDVFLTKHEVVFYAWNNVFIYTNDTIEIIDIPGQTNNAFNIKDIIYFQSDSGIYKLDKKEVSLAKEFEFFFNKKLNVLLSYNSTEFLIGTENHGLFTLENSNIKNWKISGLANKEKLLIKDGILLKNGNYTFITQHNGVLITNNNGDLLQHITKEDGLQDNNIANLSSDQQGNLWLSSYGIDYVEISSPFNHIQILPDDNYAVYSSVIYKNKLYVATHDGIYFKTWVNKNSNYNLSSSFSKIHGTANITWKLQVIDDLLIASTQKGFYVLDDGLKKDFIKTHGAWLVTKVPDLRNTYIGSTYKGLVLFEHKNGKLNIKKKLEGFTNSGRSLDFDKNNNLWTCHGYKGAYKLNLNESYDSILNVSFYGENKGFTSNLYIASEKVNNELIFKSEKGLYKYNELNDSMVIENELSSQISNIQHVRYLSQNSNKLWFINGETTGYVTYFPDGSISKNTEVFNELNQFYVPGFENLTFINENNVLFGTKSGLLYYNSNIKGNHEKEFNVLLRKVETPLSKEIIYDDRIHYLCDTLLINEPIIEYQNNNLIFNFAASFYEGIDKVKYSYYLEGFDKNWSDWNSISHKEYTNLREGNYIFRIKAQNKYNTESNEITYAFKVLPPWYRTLVAYLLYAITLFLIFILVFNWRSRQLQIEKAKFINEQLQIQELEKAKHSEEKLKIELENKNNELSGLASKVIYKNERINEIKNKIEEIAPMAVVKVNKQLVKLLGFIEQELEDDNWDNFEYRFNQAHNNFLKRFKEAYPELTPKDLKFCAYLRMNLSTKEIAQLLNMTIRGVENARYRIRKRVDLDSNDNLTNFIITF